jgi:hypothetical protein
MLKKWRQITTCQVAVFVDSSRKNRPAMLAIPLWVVGAAAEKRNPEWGARNDHRKEMR